MNVVIREIGNSKGIIIPATTLKEAGIDKMVDMRVKDGCIILEAILGLIGLRQYKMILLKRMRIYLWMV